MKNRVQAIKWGAEAQGVKPNNMFLYSLSAASRINEVHWD